MSQVHSATSLGLNTEPNPRKNLPKVASQGNNTSNVVEEGTTIALANLSRLSLSNKTKELETIMEMWINILASSKGIESSANGVMDAKLVFIGESHNDLQHIINGPAIVECASSSGDIVLVEGTPSCETKTMHGYSDKVLVLGWDISKEVFNQGVVKLSEYGKLKQQYDKACAEKDEEKIKELDPVLTKLTTEILNAIEQRNQSLISTINVVKDRYPGRKVFIPLGALHLRDESVQNFLGETKSSYIVLESKPSGKTICTVEEAYIQDNSFVARSNRVLIIKLTNGTKTALCGDWFINGNSAKVGNSVILNPDLTDPSRTSLQNGGLNFDGTTAYEVIDVLDNQSTRPKI